jgi:hypothetical protein
MTDTGTMPVKEGMEDTMTEKKSSVGRPRVAWVLLLLVAGLAALPAPVGAVSLRVGDRAPEITGERWINSPPLSIAGLRGRVVFIEFWTFG